ncbi:Sjogren's syndrome/scleroderma autoantigen 1 (Autoantigen p27) [uncultured archaeon]|nr:Sjogren's syndrome/scleroderma autoantigen 1 (Autoantigen p27) [uncultured archaeon]
MNEEEKLKRITGLLEKGCTMLATHHDCGAPLFRCKGEIVCPICSSSSAKPDGRPVGETDAVVSRDADEIKALSRIRAGRKGASSSSAEPLQAPNQEHQDDNRRKPSPPNPESERLAQNSGESSRDSEFEITKQSVRMAVIFKLRHLALDIKEERDLSRLRSQLDCVDTALRVIRALDY